MATSNTVTLTWSLPTSGTATSTNTASASLSASGKMMATANLAQASYNYSITYKTAQWNTYTYSKIYPEGDPPTDQPRPANPKIGDSYSTYEYNGSTDTDFYTVTPVKNIVYGMWSIQSDTITRSDWSPRASDASDPVVPSSAIDGDFLQAHIASLKVIHRGN